jgi:hypothetical protein
MQFIGEDAFYGCTGLTSASFSNVTVIGRRAFYGCNNLSSVSFQNAELISGYAFEGCTDLTSVSFQNAELIQGGAFNSCTALEEASFPLVQEIFSGAFQMCSSLSSVTLGTGFTNAKDIKLQNNIFGTGEVPTPNMDLEFGANVSVVAYDNTIPSGAKFAWNDYPYKSIEYKGNSLTLLVEPSEGENVGGKVIAEYNADGTTVTIEATANPCYNFVNWKEDGSTEAQRTITMDDNKTFTANFEFTSETYELTINKNIEDGGSVTGAATGITCGTEKTITATAARGYQFVNWTNGEDNEVSKKSSYSFSITEDITLKANFAEKPKKPFMKIRMKFLNSGIRL